MLMANKVVVLAIFKDEAAADAAAQSVKDSGLANDDATRVRSRLTKWASAVPARVPGSG
jgi:hypothetical protein